MSFVEVCGLLQPLHRKGSLLHDDEENTFKRLNLFYSPKDGTFASGFSFLDDVDRQLTDVKMQP